MQRSSVVVRGGNEPSLVRRAESISTQRVRGESFGMPGVDEADHEAAIVRFLRRHRPPPFSPRKRSVLMEGRKTRTR